VRKAVDAGRRAQEVVLQLGVLTTVFRGSSKKFARNDNRGLVTELDHFRSGFRIPRAQPFGYNISVLAG
jgi:hypothetical protein